MNHSKVQFHRNRSTLPGRQSLSMEIPPIDQEARRQSEISRQEICVCMGWKKIESMVPCQAFKGKLSKNLREITLNLPNDEFVPISNIHVLMFYFKV